MSLPSEFTQQYYDQDYFAVPKGKKFLRPDGSTDAWSYANPDGDWTGAPPIVAAWKEIFQCRTMLDAGCGRGTFVAYARDLGIMAFGFDYSEWAVGLGRFKRCSPDWLRVHDATRRPWPYDNSIFDLVICLDTLEHIYEEDLNSVIEELYRVCGKWVFLQIATVDGVREKGYALRKGEPIPVQLQGYAVAGHVTVQTRQWWLDRLEGRDWQPRRDMVEWFCGLVDPAIIKNWLQNTIIVLERG